MVIFEADWIMLISNVDYLFGDFWSTKLGDKPKLYIEEINISLICVLFLYRFVFKILEFINLFYLFDSESFFTLGTDNHLI